MFSRLTTLSSVSILNSCKPLTRILKSYLFSRTDFCSRHWLHSGIKQKTNKRFCSAHQCNVGRPVIKGWNAPPWTKDVNCSDKDNKTMWPPGARPQHSHSLEQCIASHLELLQYDCKVERTLESWLKKGWVWYGLCVWEGERKIYWPQHFHSPSFIISKLQAIPRIYFFKHLLPMEVFALTSNSHLLVHMHIFFRKKETKSNNKLPKKKKTIL